MRIVFLSAACSTHGADFRLPYVTILYDCHERLQLRDCHTTYQVHWRQSRDLKVETFLESSVPELCIPAPAKGLMHLVLRGHANSAGIQHTGSHTSELEP